MTTKMSNSTAMLPKEQAVAKKPATVIDHLLSENVKAQLAMALPTGMNAERFARTAINEFRLNPALQECSVPSVLGFFMQSAALGLEPATVLGHCYAVPFNNKKTGAKEVQFILGYRGMLAIARRSGEVNSVSAHIVYENDEFELVYGVQENITHRPKLDGDRGKMIGAYVVVHFKDGSYQHLYMSKEKIDAHRQRSKSSGFGPWVTDYEEMAKKTVFRAIFKWLPVNIEVAQKVANDEAIIKHNSKSTSELDLVEVDFSVTDISDMEEVEAETSA